MGLSYARTAPLLGVSASAECQIIKTAAVSYGSSHNDFRSVQQSVPSASPNEDSLRQERGGCWRYPDKFAFRCSQRSFVVSKAVNDFRGFRLVLPVQAGV